jgi:hypothetical protein
MNGQNTNLSQREYIGYKVLKLLQKERQNILTRQITPSNQGMPNSTRELA